MSQKQQNILGLEVCVGCVWKVPYFLLNWDFMRRQLSLVYYRCGSIYTVLICFRELALFSIKTYSKWKIFRRMHTLCDGLTKWVPLTVHLTFLLFEIITCTSICFVTLVKYQIITWVLIFLLGFLVETSLVVCYSGSSSYQTSTRNNLFLRNYSL